MAERKIIQDPDLVVAIDVGSTHSGYAWQWRGAFKAKEGVEFNTNWGPGTPQIHKTSTSLLLKYTNDGQTLPSIEAFGSNAESQFAYIQSNGEKVEERHNYRLFKEFKMHLYTLNKEGLSTDGSKTESVDAFPEDFLTIMYLFIKALKDDFMNKMKSKLTKSIIDKTLWIVTVPALWSEKTKMFMRTAAETAGIDETHLLLASEPECAAVYCINLPQEQQINMGNLGMAGTKFLTVDIGGNKYLKIS
ncbi:hypothetical protein DPMN_125117 [Dreissena polymorpha]|uniref:Uncharacterized protein n=1 Tax=Dreissena polymorpha TaxID=45954 RepID=A0A9D4GWX0_DREPO|nr:hypothetical protein DPMN_125117 [Dreissena polymorpha]